MSLLKAWMWMTLAIVVGFFVWNYAPVLIPFAAVTLGLGALTFGIRALARRFDNRPPGAQE